MGVIIKGIHLFECQKLAKKGLKLRSHDCRMLQPVIKVTSWKFPTYNGRAAYGGWWWRCFLGPTLVVKFSDLIPKDNCWKVILVSWYSPNCIVPNIFQMFFQTVLFPKILTQSFSRPNPNQSGGSDWRGKTVGNFGRISHHIVLQSTQNGKFE